ncbi:MAG TPA: hypothetical protein DEA55_07125 [Rhodospirillaceae bacterium]|nr:hypothetical protein [Rhodospirillaceae bacterium]
MNHYLVQVSKEAFVFGSSRTVREQDVKASLTKAGLVKSWDDAEIRIFSDDQFPSVKASVAALRDNNSQVKVLNYDPLS